jgi:hypothetical protein
VLLRDETTHPFIIVAVYQYAYINTTKIKEFLGKATGVIEPKIAILELFVKKSRFYGTVFDFKSLSHIGGGKVLLEMGKLRATRIELAYPAWEADVLPLNYARDGHL